MIKEMRTLTSTVVSINPRVPTRTISSSMDVSPLDLFKDYYFHSIYTDGSRSIKHTLASFLLDCGEVSTAGAMVIHTNRGMITVKVNMDLDSVSAFEPEVLSLLLAHEISRGRKVNIWTDCQAAIKTLNGGGLGALKYSLSGWRKDNSVAFNKVAAHPERKKDIEEWLPEERGNYLADQIAGGHIAPMFSINASEWIAKIAESTKIVVKKKGGPILVTDIRRHKSKIESTRYLQDRDNYRIKDGKPPQWVEENISSHHKLMGRSKKLVIE